MTACAMPDCIKKKIAHGLCRTHYNRNRRHGSPDRVLTHEERGERIRKGIVNRRYDTPVAVEGRRKAAETHMAKRPTITCSGCGKSFQCMKHDAAKRRFCSPACAAPVTAAEGRCGVPLVTRACIHCTKTFDVVPSSRKKLCGHECRGAWQSSLPYDQWRGKLSASREGRARGPANGAWGKSPGHGKWFDYETPDGTVRLRSTWELAIARYLDQVGIKWKYEAKRFKLRDRTYCPDFWLTETNVFWEVKGWFHERHQETVRQFREMYPQTPLIVVGEHTIKGMAAAAATPIGM